MYNRYYNFYNKLLKFFEKLNYYKIIYSLFFYINVLLKNIKIFIIIIFHNIFEQNLKKNILLL